MYNQLIFSKNRNLYFLTNANYIILLYFNALKQLALSPVEIATSRETYSRETLPRKHPGALSLTK